MWYHPQINFMRGNPTGTQSYNKNIFSHSAAVHSTNWVSCSRPKAHTYTILLCETLGLVFIWVAWMACLEIIMLLEWKICFLRFYMHEFQTHRNSETGKKPRILKILLLCILFAGQVFSKLLRSNNFCIYHILILCLLKQVFAFFNCT